MMENATATTLNEAIASQATWLQLWVMVLVVVHLLALLFVLHRSHGVWKVRPLPILILVSFVVAAAIMSWMFGQYGYVRLLGLAHIIGWGPVYAYVLMQRKHIGLATWYGKYIHLYLLVAGVSLVIDIVDVVRYLLN